MRPAILIALFLTSILIDTAYAQAPGRKQLSSRLTQLVGNQYASIAPGCVVLVAEKENVIYRKAFGTADLELGVKMRPDMVFRVGSITKQFTAVAILRLIEEGKVALKDPISKFIPHFPYDITIEHLLSHTSGIVGYDALNLPLPNVIRIDIPQRRIVDTLGTLPLQFEPGTKYQYSNSNYFLLGFIIEQVANQNYAQYLQRHLFAPAGLQSTYYDSVNVIIPNRVKGYTKSSAGFHNAGYISMTQVYSAGALVSTVDDLFHWHQALQSQKVIGKELFQKAISPMKLKDSTVSEYGFGFFIKDINGQSAIGHGGGIDGFRSFEMYFPGTDRYIAVLFNSDDDAASNLFEQIAEIAVGGRSNLDTKEIKLDTATLDRFAGTYKWVEDTTRSIIIYRRDDRLYADLSNKTGMNMPMLAQTETRFYLPVVRRIPTYIEFKIESGRVTGMYWIQDRKYEGKRVD